MTISDIHIILQWYTTSIKQMVQKYASCTTGGHVHKSTFLYCWDFNPC